MASLESGNIATPQKELDRPSPAAANQIAEQYDFTRIDKLLKSATPKIGSGALLLIKDGKVIYRKTFGDYQIEKASLSHRQQNGYPLL